MSCPFDAVSTPLIAGWDTPSLKPKLGDMLARGRVDESSRFKGCLLLMSSEWHRSDFARDRLKLLDRRPKGSLDAVQLPADLCVVVSSNEHYSVEQLRLGEWILPVGLVRAGFDRVSNDFRTCGRPDRTRLHPVFEMTVRRAAEVFSEDSSHLIRLSVGVVVLEL
jgi:hypothetical protein